MNAVHELIKAYAEWRRLAEAEGEAISARDWTRVTACQAGLQKLQIRISRLVPAARAAWAQPGADQNLRQKLRTTVHDLLELARRNHALLTSLKESARLKLAELGRAGRNLKQIHHCYGWKGRATWSSLS